MGILRHAPLLRHFLAVEKEGSLSAAANALAVTQPALTKSIQRLETELGVKLFERLPRGIALTKFGAALLPHAQRIESECSFADRELQAFGQGQVGRLKVGSGELFSATLLPRAIAALQQTFPALEVVLVSAVTEDNYPALLAGELDIIFGTLPSADPLPEFLVAVPMVDVRSRVIAGAHHPLVAKKSVNATELAEYPWAALRHDRETIRQLFAVLDAGSERQAKVAVELTSLSSLVQLLRSGPYLSCFAEGLPMLQPHLGLALVPYEVPIWQHGAGAVMHRSLKRYLPAQMLVELVGKEAGVLDEV